MTFQQIVDDLALNPRKLFLIDGIGALLSAFLLGVVLVRFEHVFGMPETSLYCLAAMPILFMIYDLYCYFQIREYRKPYLKVIAFVNLTYCCISLGFLIHHRTEMTNLGWLYFVLEIITVVTLATIELKADAKLRQS